jgi:hypothetical protein
LTQLETRAGLMLLTNLDLFGFALEEIGIKLTEHCLMVEDEVGLQMKILQHMK